MHRSYCRTLGPLKCQKTGLTQIDTCSVIGPSESVGDVAHLVAHTLWCSSCKTMVCNKKSDVRIRPNNKIINRPNEKTQQAACTPAGE